MPSAASFALVPPPHALSDAADHGNQRKDAERNSTPHQTTKCAVVDAAMSASVTPGAISINRNGDL